VFSNEARRGVFAFGNTLQRNAPAWGVAVLDHSCPFSFFFFLFFLFVEQGGIRGLVHSTSHRPTSQAAIHPPNLSLFANKKKHKVPFSVSYSLLYVPVESYKGKNQQRTVFGNSKRERERETNLFLLRRQPSTRFRVFFFGVGDIHVVDPFGRFCLLGIVLRFGYALTQCGTLSKYKANAVSCRRMVQK
jgi:hypothetical protein